MKERVLRPIAFVSKNPASRLLLRVQDGISRGMRIIAGTAGGVPLKVPAGETRPTTDRVREALFSLLGDWVEDARVLDLFAGSGALGLEALSRGAASVLFVDQGANACKAIEQNLAKTRLPNAKVTKAEVLSFVARDRGAYDLIFADPPYAKGALEKDFIKELFKAGTLPERLAEKGWLVVETSADTPAPETREFALVERRVYGGTAILLYRKAEGL